MTNRTDGLDAAGVAAAHRVMFGAVADSRDISPVDMHAAIYAYLEATRRSALVDAPAGETIDGPELWEIVFGILKGDVPDELTDDVFAQIAAALASPTPSVAALQTRDIYEVANQLEGYVDPGTPEPLAQFLLKEGQAASDLADRIVALQAEIDRLDRLLNEEQMQTANGGEIINDLKARLAAAVAALLPPDTEGEAQPVAWQHRILFEDTGNWSDWRDGTMPTYLDNEVETRPLFASPRPAVSEAMTDEQVRRILSAKDVGSGRALITAALASVPGKGWQGMDSAPKDGTRVDLWVRPWDAFANGNAARITDAWFEDGEWKRTLAAWPHNVSSCGEPTHWMPLPASPSPSSPEDGR